MVINTIWLKPDRKGDESMSYIAVFFIYLQEHFHMQGYTCV